MDKKKKRASFSFPPTPKAESLYDDAPTALHPPKQVVEVVTEEPADDLYETRRPQPKREEVEYVRSPRHEVARDERQEEAPRRVSSVVVETPRVVVDHPGVVEIVDDDIEEPEERSMQPRRVASSVTHESPQEVTVVASAEPVHRPEVHMLHHTEEEETQATQKSTVAELFGQGHESPMPEITVHHNKNHKNIILWGITMLAVAIGVGGGLILFTTPKQPAGQQQVNVTPEPTQPVAQTTVAPTAAPSPTTAPVSRKDLKVQVQNGGGVVGAGSKMKSALTDKGYTVSDVRNADDYTYDTTVIKVKSSKSAALPLLKTDLGTDYTIGTADASLPDSSPYDAVVIVGKK